MLAHLYAAIVPRFQHSARSNHAHTRAPTMPFGLYFLRFLCAATSLCETGDAPGVKSHRTTDALSKALSRARRGAPAHLDQLGVRGWILRLGIIILRRRSRAAAVIRRTRELPLAPCPERGAAPEPPRGPLRGERHGLVPSGAEHFLRAERVRSRLSQRFVAAAAWTTADR